MLRVVFLLAAGTLFLAWLKTRKSTPSTPWEHYVKGWRRE